jgi:hypothetical protein
LSNTGAHRTRQADPTETGKVVNAKIVDRCAGCKPGDIDMDKSIFYQVDAAGDGRLKGVSWSIV